MSWLAVWLLGVAVADLVRSLELRALRRARWAAPVAGGALVLALLPLAGLTGWWDVIVLVLSIGPLVGWHLASERTLRDGAPQWPALCCLLGTPVLLIALSGSTRPIDGPFADWLRSLDLALIADQSPGKVLLVLSIALVNLTTANRVVRSVLIGVGALRPRLQPGLQPSDRLKGGRLLGPMERILILGLGLAGDLTAAAIVVAAKGLLRFPELQSTRTVNEQRGTRIDEVTEYFLVGSFVSWLIALGSILLAAG